MTSTSVAGTGLPPAEGPARPGLVVKRVDHVPHRTLIYGGQPGDRRGSRGGCHDDHRPPNPDRPALSAPHDPLPPTALLISQPPRPCRLSAQTGWWLKPPGWWLKPPGWWLKPPGKEKRADRMPADQRQAQLPNATESRRRTSTDAAAAA